MFALTIDTDLLTKLDSTTWIVLGGLAVLWGSKYIPAGLLDKVKGWFTLDDSPAPDVEDITDAAKLIKQLSERRIALQQELDLINAALNDNTEIDPA